MYNNMLYDNEGPCSPPRRPRSPRAAGPPSASAAPPAPLRES